MVLWSFMKGLFGKIFGDDTSRALKRLQPKVAEINAFEESLLQLTQEEMRAKTEAFKKRIQEGDELDVILPEAFALVREASKRTLGQRHFDVQLLGGMILHERGIAEMRTGEGKTLVATLPTYLNALAQKGVHVVTVNDYLARRDAVWMGQIYSYLGLSIGVISGDESYLYDPEHVIPQNEEIDTERDELGSFKVRYEFLRPCTRREAYAADITYGTNSQFGFDYLRDNIEYDKNRVRQRGHFYAVVDEIDSILIDEARTPLIISAPAGESESFYTQFAHIASTLKEGDDYSVDEKLKAITLTDVGIEKAERVLGVENIYTDKGIKYVHHLETAVRAKALFKKDVEYVVKDGQIIIVDTFTGRLQPGRRWSEGLHQAIEAKEHVPIQKETRTFASITYQNYFRMYSKLSGMTGTAMTSSEEFLKVYDLLTIAVPTNRPIARIDHNDLIFQTEKGKFNAIAKKVKELHANGQPVLIGTASIERNELLSAYLTKEGIPHEVLNAKNHEREGEIIAQAGRKGAVTIATNMAGRGVDVKLGGNPTTDELYAEVREKGGLFVVGTERHEARRIDNQLRGRAGRQGDPGETQFFVSLEDSLMRIFASDTLKRVMGSFGIPEDQPIENGMISRTLESAQTKIEGHYFDSRKHVLEYDNVLNQQRTSIYKKRKDVLFADEGMLETILAERLEGNTGAQTHITSVRATVDPAQFWNAFRQLYLQTIDMYWIEHLESMDYMRSSVNLRAYGQRDPLVEYKKEGSRMFKECMASIDGNVERVLEHFAPGGTATSVELQGARSVVAGAKQITKSGVVEKSGSKYGRNDQVTIEKNGVRETMKYKKAEALIEKEGWVIVK